MGEAGAGSRCWLEIDFREGIGENEVECLLGLARHRAHPRRVRGLPLTQILSPNEIVLQLGCCL